MNSIIMLFKNYLLLIGRFLKTLFNRFIDDGCTYRAAALTYTTLLSLVPLMTVSFAIFAAFPVFGDISLKIQNFIFSHFIAASGQVIQEYVNNFVEQAKHLSAIGSVFLVLTAVLMMFNMEQAFNAIWKVKSRSMGISTFMLYWAVLTLTPILIGLSIAISSYLENLHYFHLVTTRFGLMTILPFILNLTFFTLIYIMVPNCSVPLRHGFAGALVATILFTLAKSSFAYYVTTFPTYTMVYGALATIPIFLVWIYVMWIIILFGVIISNMLSTRYYYRSEKKLDGFTHVYCWLGYFWLALQQGQHLSLGDLLNRDSCNYEVDPERQLQLMLEQGLIQSGASGRYVLSQDLSLFTLYDLLIKLPWRLPIEEELSQWSRDWESNLRNFLRTEMDYTKLHIPLSKLFSIAR